MLLKMFILKWTYVFKTIRKMWSNNWSLKEQWPLFILRQLIFKIIIPSNGKSFEVTHGQSRICNLLLAESFLEIK